MGENRIIKIFTIGICIIAIYVAYVLPQEDWKNTLITLAQINIAIAVGVGALSVGDNKKRKTINLLKQLTVYISVLSLLTFLVANAQFPVIVNGAYFVSNVLVIGILLTVVLKPEGNN
ncbi:hypothetical protein LAV73_08505 [Lysinibacillus xylanilyticus]|uniref:hypothetical protein n=1 Tax=Lysinibacillus xylanilyticus TaxID=582475 RepID=UPI002B24FDC7|nr:hypothetical protein [Lysinibacillus xylanilyticus]MEB2280043.1 hypothetical protein [Lysinibacillus xylanilyticus]